MTAPGRQRRGVVTALLIAAVVIVAGAIILIVSTTRAGQMSASAHPTSSEQPSTPPTVATPGTLSPSPITGSVLPHPMGGQEAIDALGDKIDFVAKRNGKTVDELKDLLLRDKTAQVSVDGFIAYVDTFE